VDLEDRRLDARWRQEIRDGVEVEPVHGDDAIARRHAETGSDAALDDAGDGEALVEAFFLRQHQAEPPGHLASTPRALELEAELGARVGQEVEADTTHPSVDVRAACGRGEGDAQVAIEG